jgi:hypothetical protein
VTRTLKASSLRASASICASFNVPADLASVSALIEPAMDSRSASLMVATSDATSLPNNDWNVSMRGLVWVKSRMYSGMVMKIWLNAVQKPDMISRNRAKRQLPQNMRLARGFRRGASGRPLPSGSRRS